MITFYDKKNSEQKSVEIMEKGETYQAQTK